jgi:hypothetical protein
MTQYQPLQLMIIFAISIASFVFTTAIASNPPLTIIQLKTKKVKIDQALMSRIVEEIDSIDPKDTDNHFEAELIDLNQDGQSEIIVLCSNFSTNWPILIFSEHGKQLILLLNEIGNDYHTLKPIHHGYHDLLIRSHCSAALHLNTFYQFDGKKYREIKHSMESNP